MSKIPKLTLKKISKLNLMSILQLNVKPEQRNLVASNAKSIAEAHFNKDAWFRAIYADKKPIGFVMISDTLLKYKSNPNHRPSYYLWRFILMLNFKKKDMVKKQ